MKKSPLTAEELREVEIFDSLSYDELLDYIKRQSLLESKETVIKDIDMTYDEFVSTYDSVNLGDFLGSFGVKLE